MSSLALRGRVVAERQVWEAGTVVIEGSTIRSVTSERVKADEVLDVGDSIMVPGFVDLQLNGTVGVDIATQPGRLEELSTKLPQAGTTCYLPTIVTRPLSEYPSLLAGISLDPGGGAEPLGLHLEGPFINPKKKGAHPEESVAPPDPQTLAALAAMLDAAPVRMVTLAPEMSGFLASAETAISRGALVSLGHSDASFEDSIAALGTGARGVTHLFNAMSPLHHRDPGLPGAALAHAKAHCSIIADGRHVHPEMVRLAFERLGPDRMYLVTDAIAAAGMGPGEYSLAGHRVFMQDGVPRLENGTLAGSVLTMDEALRNVMAFTGCSLPEAVRMAATTPARLIGEDRRKGKLAPGSDADVVVLSPELEVEAVWIGGREVVSREGLAGSALREAG